MSWQDADPRCVYCRQQALSSLTHLHLDRLHLCGPVPAQVMTCMPALTHVYLQHNKLTSLAGLAALPALRFAALSHNCICEVGVVAVGVLLLQVLKHSKET